MEYKDYYSLLNVEKTADLDQIQAAYEKLEEAPPEVEEAYIVLSQPDRRAKYDQLTTSWQTHQRFNPDQPFDWTPWIITENVREDSDYSEFFQAVLEQMGAKEASPPPQPGEDYHQTVEISLDEAFKGTSRILRIGNRRIEIKIPRGARTGTKVRVRGEGGEGAHGGPKGDLYLEISLTPDPIFERKGDDLYMDLPIDLYTAVLGGEAIVPTFKGKIRLKIPVETQSGRVFRLKGQGMPSLKQPDERGDLYAKAMIQLPENLTADEFALFEELADMRGM